MEFVTLGNGRKIEWDEFSKWNSSRQKHSLNPFLTRGVITPDGMFNTIIEAADFYQVRGATIREWIKNGKNGFKFSTAPKERKAPVKKGGASGANNGYARAVITPSGRFDSFRQAQNSLGLSYEKLYELINNSKNGEFRFETERPPHKNGKRTTARRVMTPAGLFETLGSAAKHYGVRPQRMPAWIKAKNDPSFYIIDPPKN